MTPRTARTDVVRDTYVGTTIDDPYRWIEDWTSDEAQAWLSEQAVYARKVLDALPERDTLFTRDCCVGGRRRPEQYVDGRETVFLLAS